MNNKLYRKLSNRALDLLTLIFVGFAIFPFIWALSTSFKHIQEIYQIPPTVLPESLSLHNYSVIFEQMPFLRFAFNSLIITFATIVITVILSLLGGYAFSRFKFPFKYVLLMLILIPRIIPSITRVIPLYQLFAEIGLLDSYLGLILPYVADATPIGIWVLMGFFDGIPKSIDEQALVDGCSKLEALIKVIVPLTKPGMISVALFAFIRSWNEFIIALTFMRGNMLTLPVGHYRVFEFFGVRHWGAINAYTIIVVIPIVIFFIFFERQMIRGMTAGSVKG